MHILIITLAVLFSLNKNVRADDNLIKARIAPCGAGVSHPDNGAENKSGSDHAILNSNQGEFRLEAKYGSNKSQKVEINPWQTTIQDLRFQFTSESYGTEYFVDFCYYGPEDNTQADYLKQLTDLSKGIYSAQVSIDIRGSNESYPASAKLFTRYEAVCDLRNKGLHNKARSNEEVPSGAIEQDIYWSSDFMPIQNGYFNIETQINQSASTVPRFCAFRVHFAEKSKGPRSYKGLMQDIHIFIDIKKGGSTYGIY